MGRRGCPASAMPSRISRSDERTDVRLARMKKDQEGPAWLDATGLPVFTWGLILRGVPQELAATPEWSWLFVLVGIFRGVRHV